MNKEWNKFKKNVKKNYKKTCLSVAKAALKAEMTIENKISEFKEKKHVSDVRRSTEAPLKAKDNMVTINVAGFSESQMNKLRDTVKEIRNENNTSTNIHSLVKGQVYYTIDSDRGIIREVIATGSNFDKTNISLGNVYFTKEAAKDAGTKRAIEVKLRRFASENNEVFEVNKYFYFKKNVDENGDISISIIEFNELIQGAIAFSSEAVAKKALKVFGVEKIEKIF